MNGREFAQEVKRKYPQYSGFSDEYLTIKVLEKYPQYRKVVKPDDIPQYAITPPKTQQAAPQQPVTNAPVQQTNTQQPEFMKMSRREFGQLVKKRFPQYSELSDERVAALALKKFPQYHDIVKPDDIPQQPVAAAGGTEEEAVKAYENAVSAMDYTKEGTRQLLRVIVSPLNLLLSIPILYFIKRRRQKKYGDDMEINKSTDADIISQQPESQCVAPERQKPKDPDAVEPEPIHIKPVNHDNIITNFVIGISGEGIKKTKNTL